MPWTCWPARPPPPEEPRHAATMEARAAGQQLGRIRPRRPARPHESGGPRQGAAGHRGGPRGPDVLPVAAAGRAGRHGAEPAAPAAAALRHAARWQERRGPGLLLVLRVGRPAAHGRGVRRRAADEHTVFHPVGQPGAHGQPVRCRWRRAGRGGVLQRLSGRRRNPGGRGGSASRGGLGPLSRPPAPGRSASSNWPNMACRAAPC